MKIEGGKRVKKTAVICLAMVLILIPAITVNCASSSEKVVVSITNQAVNLSAFTVYNPEQKLNNPEAGDLKYVYLIKGQDAVRLAGPTVTSSVSIVLDNEAITKVGYDYFYDEAEEGYEVKINSHIIYRVEIDDFEDEVDLAKVELTKEGNSIKSSFIFAASVEGDGIAHDVTITAVIDDSNIGSSSPISIEVR